MGRADHDRSPIQEQTNELARQKPPWKQTVSRKKAQQVNTIILLVLFTLVEKEMIRVWVAIQLQRGKLQPLRHSTLKVWRMKQKQEAPFDIGKPSRKQGQKHNDCCAVFKITIY